MAIEQEFIDKLISGDKRTLSRAISKVEDGDKDSIELLQMIIK